MVLLLWCSVYDSLFPFPLFISRCFFVFVLFPFLVSSDSRVECLDAPSSGFLQSNVAGRNVLDRLPDAGPVAKRHKRDLGVFAPSDEVWCKN